MKKIIIIFLITYTICPLWGQMVYIGFGPTYIADKSKVKLHPEILGKGLGGNDDWFYQISYVHWINKKILISGSYSKYPIATLFNFQSENGGSAYGWPGGIHINRLDLGIVWNTFQKTKFIVHPNINLGLQISRSKDVGIIGTIPKDILPLAFEQLQEIEANAYSNIQIVPVIGLKLGYAFWNRLELFFDIKLVWGFNTVQELTLQYSYKGVRQPDAINYSDGTGRFYALGLGYRFVKPK